MKIIAHRGASFEAPENTAAAFRLAWEEGADGTELDVRLTRDGRVAVFHDEDMRRITGRPGRVGDLALAGLKALDAGSWKGGRWRGERIPELGEVMGAMPAGKIVFVEIKCGAEILPALRKAVDDAGLDREQVRFLGFSLETMRAAKEAFPEHDVLLNVELRRRRSAARMVRDVRSAGLDGVGAGVHGDRHASIVARLLEAGLQLLVWTVDDADRARTMRGLGVHGLCTNRPGWLRSELEGS